ncbi:hypothetical protein BX600DRAFT_504536 [Xylariales sp. PMI_506]|nr:hypothetical protein BX600DRAFT_504536 [Xylariales sp. PMI_506]
MSEQTSHGYEMGPRYDEAPEVAPPSVPEVHQPHSAPEVYQRSQYTPQTLHAKPEGSPLHSGGYTTGSTLPGSSYGYDQSQYGGAHSEAARQSRKPAICGCTVLVFILSTIIALLSAAVIGLAAGTGIEASHASDAQASLSALKASISAIATTTVTAASSTATGFDVLDRNCTSNPDGVSGSTYTSSFFNHNTFAIYCNQDTPNAPLQSLFVANIEDCMDACASYSYYMPSDFSNSTAQNQTCDGISFVPAWTNRTTAVKGFAPGNCYLKPGPQNTSALYTPTNGQETHGAIIKS